MPLDRIIVEQLSVRSIIGLDSWERRRPQPVSVSLAIHSNVQAAGDADSLAKSVSYAHVAKAVSELAERDQHATLEELAHRIATLCLGTYDVPKISVKVEKPKALLHASNVAMEITRTRASLEHLERLQSGAPSSHLENHSAPTLSIILPEELWDDIFTIERLQVDAVVGVNPWERLEKQKISITIKIHGGQLQPQSVLYSTVPPTSNYRAIANAVTKHVEESKYLTIEGLATSIADHCFEVSPATKLTVRVDKPSAILFASAAAVEITRTRPPANPSKGHLTDGSDHVVYIGIGTNIGDRHGNIHHALQLLRRKCTILDTSYLYETTPMYKLDQPNFLNCAVKIATSLDPLSLLAFLKSIEREMGRQLTVRNGPRVIDLDILLFDGLVIKEDELEVPHIGIPERDFVLRPLCDIAPALLHPTLHHTVEVLLSSLLSRPVADGGSVMRRVTPICGSLWAWGEDTPAKVMGIVNVTPDSFSDGGDRFSSEAAAQAAVLMVQDGADIIDIGGLSTRPNSDEVTEEEELARVVPAVRAIRAAGVTLPISVDTFRSRVAREALAAGADIINDVSGGTRDPAIVTVAAETFAPLCLMHSRGDSRTMTTRAQYEDVVAESRHELADLVKRAVAGGVPRWNIIVDPGIGFAKTLEHNLEILRRLADFAGPSTELDGYPVLVGASRKAFIGKITGQVDPKQRGWGTAATSAAAVAGGAALVRVHDVKETRDVVAVANHIWRTRSARKD